MSGRFHHMDIYVGGLERSVAFWGPVLERLGFVPEANRSTVKSWRGPGAELFFVQTEADFIVAGYHRKRIGLNHIAFAVERRAELEQLVEFVRSLGARMLYEGTDGKGAIEETPRQWRFFFEDPDRIKVEVVAERGG